MFVMMTRLIVVLVGGGVWPCRGHNTGKGTKQKVVPKTWPKGVCPKGVQQCSNTGGEEPTTLRYNGVLLPPPPTHHHPPPPPPPPTPMINTPESEADAANVSRPRFKMNSMSL
jgi:hypothetical protein